MFNLLIVPAWCQSITGTKSYVKSKVKSKVESKVESKFRRQIEFETVGRTDHGRPIGNVTAPRTEGLRPIGLTDRLADREFYGPEDRRSETDRVDRTRTNEQTNDRTDEFYTGAPSLLI